MTTSNILTALRTSLASVLRGKEEALDLVLVGVLAGGHVLLEDVPGVGKTTLAKGLARLFQVEFARVQFTPDLLPSDIVGSPILNPKEGTFAFRKGPIFTQVLLADEINRASPRTQSALLEAMSEGQVTVDGVTHALPDPFFVIATQNPSDFSGTYPLPEAQLDRFLLRLSIGYPGEDAELEMLFAHKDSSPLEALQPVCSQADWSALQKRVRDLRVEKNVAAYIVHLVGSTRDAEFELGASPRASLALFRASQAWAFLRGRDFVTPDDVQAMAVPTLAHRVRLSHTGRQGGRTEAAQIRSLLKSVEIPR
ncbi:MAG: MoxR family ATPase [Polyangiaceae bacterium]|nr:MoxR family ATPase [Polyangiaceae bacterium]